MYLGIHLLRTNIARNPGGFRVHVSHGARPKRSTPNEGPILAHFMVALSLVVRRVLGFRAVGGIEASARAVEKAKAHVSGTTNRHGRANRRPDGV